MSHEEITEAQMRKYLSAFADGELEVETNLEVLQHLTMNTQATRRVMHLEQLRQGLQKHVEASTPKMPAELEASLREQVAELSDPEISALPALKLAQTDNAADVQKQQDQVSENLKNWNFSLRIMTAAAAVLVVTTLIGLTGLFNNPAQNQNIVIKEVKRPTEIMLTSANQASMMTQQHITCTTYIDKLGKNGKTFSGSMETVLPEMAKFMGVADLPDLSLKNINGYEFVRAGECQSGKNAIHLVYQGTENEQQGKTMSLWIMPLQIGQSLDEKQLFSHTGGKSDVLFWRKGQVVYFLIGADPMTSQQSARELMLI